MAKQKKRRQRLKTRGGGAEPLGKPRPDPLSGFKGFFTSVTGVRPSIEERAGLQKRFESISQELKEPKTSEKRRREIWNRLARAWNRMVWFPRVRQEAKIILMYGNIRPNDAIASIASGTGVLGAFLAKQFVPNGRVTCIDFSPEMSRQAEITKKNAAAHSMRVVTAPAQKTGLPSASQNKVLLMQTTLAGRQTLRPILQEAQRIIKKTPDARFFVSFTTEKQKLYEVSRIIEEIKSSGFQPEAVIKYVSSPATEGRVVIASPAAIL